jgi:hypothetical protein
VLIATGLYSDIPNLPDIPGQEDFQGEILYIPQVKTRASLDGKRVAVLGYGKSAAGRCFGSGVRGAKRFTSSFAKRTGRSRATSPESYLSNGTWCSRGPQRNTAANTTTPASHAAR